MPYSTSLHVNTVALQLSAYAVTYLCQEFCVRAADRATHEPVQLMAPLTSQLRTQNNPNSAHVNISLGVASLCAHVHADVHSRVK